MLSLKKVAVTGGLSCGKSSVCRFFKELGAHVISADEIVHHLLSPHTSLGQQVIVLLGEDIIVNGKIDRSLIAKKVFNNPAQLDSLEKLIHPAVSSEIEREYKQASKQGTFPLFIAEIPLLFETSAETWFDTTIAIQSSPQACKERFTKATGYGEEEYNKRMAYQMPANEKAKRADYVIDNSSDLEYLHQTVAALFKKLTT